MPSPHASRLPRTTEIRDSIMKTSETSSPEAQGLEDGDFLGAAG
jgi:hypothetical protein